MADSDDEYDRRRGRDKFRRERNDYERRDDRRREGGWDNDRYRNTSAARSRNNSGRNREVWSSRSRDRGNYNRDGYDSRRRDRYSPGSPPQMKRMRRDWDDNYQPYNDMPYGGGPMHGPGGPPHHWGPGPDMGGGMGPQQGQFGGPGPNRPDVDYPTQPPMLTFKQFLSQQDDNIDDQEAIKKYNEYKIDFRRQQINDFFLAHKEEEWFKAKYHPEECERKHEESRLGLQRRLSVFVELLGTPYVENVTVDMEKATELVKLLDAAVLKMEGGSEFDLKSLEEPEVAPEEGNRSRNDSESQSTDKIISPVKQRTRKDKEADTVTVVEGEATATPEGTAAEGPIELPMTKEQEDLKKAAQEFSKNQISPGAEDGDDGEGSTSGKKRKRGRDKSQYSYESGSDSDSGSESEPEPAPPGELPGKLPGEATGETRMEEDGETPRADTSAHNTTGSPEKPSPEAREAEPKRTPNKEVAEGEEKDIDTGSQEPQPRALHKTNSIFLRHLAPSITKQEVEAMCKRYPGFLRVALQDPLPERHFFRRGWVTFDRNVNIKDICYNLNNIRLRECELNATVNRELKQRVRPVSWMTSHKSVVRQDIKHTAKIIQNLDSKWGLWEDTADEKKDTEKEVPSYGLVSRNPVLKNITDYLVDEGSFEEEEYLGQSIDDEPKEANPELPLERDPTLLKVVDRMILYLRIVHSVDYYSATEFPNEDEMPNRCGIMHARGTTPNSKFSQADANEWTQNFERKLKNLLEVQGRVNEEEAVRLGRKDPAAEVEKFVTANTQELAKDKWLCPLSGKKFKGPEFVRKHIFNKHAEKIDEVKKEVSFFNNYLMDPKRPTLPEHPGNKPQGGREGFMGPGNFQGPPQQMGYNQSRPHMGYGNGPHYGSGPPRGDNFRQDGGFNRRNQHGRSFGRRSDPRGIIEYRDLDAPDDMDMF